MTEVRNILIIGRTGNGKSALANVISGTNKFKEGRHIVSQTGDNQTEEIEINGIKYRIIDTVGIDHTVLTNEQVLGKIAEVAHSIKDSLNQILFVIGGKFTKEEIFAYNLLRSIFFDENITKYTTIVKTKFPEFENEKECEKDREKLIKELNLTELISSCKNVIYVDNPPLEDHRPRDVE